MASIDRKNPWLLAAFLFSASVAVHALPAEPGVSHQLAIVRAQRLSDLHYSLAFALKPHAASTEATEVLRFSDSGTGDLPLDYRDGTITSATLNGKPIATALDNGHLMLPSGALAHGANELHLAFTSQIAAAGKAITRYDDSDDKNEYIYTLFVPMDASMAFPCFDQPDLKARFTLAVTHPLDWTVIANTAPTPTPDATHSTFPESRPISTYLFAFAAGPFASIPGAGPGQPTVFVRKSQLARARGEAPQVQQLTARGIHYLEDYFQQPFPFPKYDLVLIPGFPFGGMEHAGETFLNEDGVLFRSAPTQADYFRRNTLVLHETTHQWFGDFVTMRWFDDLWLKEGFAQYMAYHALAELEPAQQPWKHFYEDIKPLAYAIDETQGTTPIFQNILNLKDAKSAYGAIVYQKAPAVLKQLEYFLGEQNFRDGLRLYLKQHAYANAQWADLIGAFQSTGKQDVQAWAKAWILQRGMPQVEADWTCKSGAIDHFALTQHDVLAATGEPRTWPITTDVLFAYPPGSAHASRTLRVAFDRAEQPVPEAIGRPCPAFVFANQNDHAYGRFLLDPTSQKAVIHTLKLGAPGLASETRAEPARTPQPSPPLLTAQLWGALWDNVRIARTPPRDYIDLALKTLPTETDESLNRIQGARIAAALHAYLGPKSREAVLPQAEQVAADRMLHAPTLGLRIVNFRTFTSIAETPAALAQLKQILAGTLSIEGLKLRPLDRWNLIGHLIAQHDPDAAGLFAAEQVRDKSGEALKYIYAVQAGTPDTATKQRYWDDYLHNPNVQEDWITQSLGAFNSWNQADLTLPYLAQALDQLPDIKLHRKIFFLGAWLNSFLGGQHTAAAQTVVHAWLARKDLDPDLRLKVLEVSDALDRTVLIRQRFPE